MTQEQSDRVYRFAYLGEWEDWIQLREDVKILFEKCHNLEMQILRWNELTAPETLKSP